MLGFEEELIELIHNHLRAERDQIDLHILPDQVAKSGLCTNSTRSEMTKSGDQINVQIQPDLR